MIDVSSVTARMDAARSLLIAIQKTHPRFYNEFVREYLTDRQTLTNFERDMSVALKEIAGIDLFADSEMGIWVAFKSIREPFDDYESAMRFAIGLLYTIP